VFKPVTGDEEAQEVALEKEQEEIGELKQTQITFPDGGTRAWLVVFGAGLAFFVSFGLMNAWGVLETYYLQTILKDSSESSVSWIQDWIFPSLWFVLWCWRLWTTL
jgi:hypothetical protein